MRKRCDMNNYSEKFKQILESENKEQAVNFAMGLIKNNELDIIELYSNILKPALNNMQCSLADKDLCVWKEHVRTAIVRTIVECCYPYVIAKRDKECIQKRGKVIILCPPEEYHDLGARMITDYFTICGYDAVFVGNNTPYDNFYNAADKINPDIIAISVSNYYNLVVTKKIIEGLRGKIDKKTKIVVGGYAFSKDSKNISIVGADYYTDTFEDIKRVAEKEMSI
jgi:methanogenic corrinoid protein MtbC1